MRRSTFTVLLSSVVIALLTADFTPAGSQTRWTKYPDNPVFGEGTPNSWESSGVVAPSIFFDGTLYTLWYAGSGLESKFRIGFATSPDGIQWRRYTQNPILDVGTAASWDDAGAGAPRVLVDSVQRMWYTGSIGSQFGTWRIGYASSPDGRSWQKSNQNPVLDLGVPGSWESGWVSNPAVLSDGKIFRMWYEGDFGGGGIGLATSPDGIHWTKDSSNPVLRPGPPGSWDEAEVAFPIAVHDVIFHLWYVVTRVGIGYATSPDGRVWTKYAGNPVLRTGDPGSWDVFMLGGAIVRSGSSFLLWYTGFGTPDGPRRIGHATSPRAPATIEVRKTGSMDFGNVPPGFASDTISFVIANRGFTPLSINSLTTGHPEYAVTSHMAFPATIPPFQESRIGVVFHPLLAGTVVQDSISIASSDSLQPVITVSLRGRGSGPVQSALPGRIYGITASSSDVHLVDVSKSTGGVTSLAHVTPHPPPSVDAFSIRPSDRVMYAAYTSPSQTLLYRISSAFGDLEAGGSIPLGGVTAIAFSPGDLLYLADDRGRLYRAGVTGTDTILAGTPGVVLTGLASQPVTGTLWGSAHDTIYTINAGTGELTRVGRTGLDGRSTIAFGPLGSLYALSDRTLMLIDRVTGRGTMIGTTGTVDIRGIAMSADLATESKVTGPGDSVAWRLFQNFPNPFNPTTEIRYGVPGTSGQGASEVRLAVFDLLGREVALLVHEAQLAGIHTVQFDAAGLASGVYYYRLRAGASVDTKKLMLVR